MAVNEDLTRILQILSASTQATQAVPRPLPPVRSDEDDDSYSPPPAITPDPRQTYPPPSVHVSREAAVDPSKIEEWNAALRYIMKEVCKNEAIMAGIKKMINSQHEHEKAWHVALAKGQLLVFVLTVPRFRAREEIVNKHKVRKESGKKVEDVLRKLGTLPLAQQAIVQPTPESEAEELALFDRKVYTRSEQMVAHMTREFGSMGIPFFCHPSSASPEMLDRKRRMVELLQDLSE
ncbi:unnamed protein product [Tuber melanosporum]|uniref:(Perigord truffle) hypothetical protein n=1 Tax=Tuber melanosporum (strain Mel28) TaxID=656061 RepID=D5G843_TUBMM|nr:uncharacterized protein GSTUM_00002806001 [Tuber melanosporum]CAZ80686.1 unnamed protein product [Tuber melanosporum]